MMKKTIALVAVIAATATTGFSQGLTFFNNYIGFDAPLTLGGVQSNLYGPDYEAALFVAGTEGIAATPLASVAFFPAGSTGEGYFDFVNSVAVPGVAAGETASLVVVGWDAATQGSLAYGQSTPFNVVLGGGTAPPGNLGNMSSFDVAVVPEPSTIAMIALGLGAVVFRFRRK